MAVLFVSGVSFRSAPVELRERLAVGERQVPEVLAELQSRGPLSEVVLLSTCNRVEIYGVDERAGDPSDRGFDVLCERCGVEPRSVRASVYTKTAREAVRHGFRVASSLDSMIVGEPQIVGQVKEAFARAERCQTVGPRLRSLFTRAFTVAKRVRSETGVAEHAVSVSFAAVELARKVFGDLHARSALLVGAGEMAELAARQLMDHGVGPLYVANRTESRAVELATTLPGRPVKLEGVGEVLRQVDVVITATGAPQAFVTPSTVRAVLEARRGRPLLFVDVAVPRNVDPGVHALGNVFCYDIDDLQQVVEANIRERQREAVKAEALVDRAVESFLSDLCARDVIPTIVALREKVEAIRQAEVSKPLARLTGAAPETREVVEALSSAIVNKILHGPTARLRDAARQGAGDGWAESVCGLFSIDPASTCAAAEPQRWRPDARVAALAPGLASP